MTSEDSSGTGDHESATEETLGYQDSSTLLYLEVGADMVGQPLRHVALWQRLDTLFPKRQLEYETPDFTSDEPA